MTKRSVDFVLTAKDNASSVFRKTKEELELLNKEVQAGTKEFKASSDAFGKLLNAMGLGSLASSAREMKNLADVAKQASGSLASGGVSALAMKAGLVGLVAYGSFAIGQMIGNWLFETDKFQKELEEQEEKAIKLGADLAAAREKQTQQMLSELKEFGGTYDEQKKVAEDRLEILKKDRNQQQALVALGDERAKQAEVALESTQRQIDLIESSFGARASELEQRREGIRRDQHAEQERVKALQEQFAQEEKIAAQVKVKGQSLQDEILRLENSAEQYEIIKAFQITADVAERNKLKTMIEQKFELQRQNELRAQAARDQEDALKREERQKIKMAQEAVKQTQREIAELEKIKVDVSPTLGSGDQRITSLGTGDNTVERQQLELSRRQIEIQIKQEKLLVEIARLAKLEADKQDPVINIAGA